MNNRLKTLISYRPDKDVIASWIRTPLPLFTLAHGSHDMALSLLVPLLPLIRTDFGLSYLKAGLLVSSYTITSGFAQLPMGWVADRVGPRRMIAAGLGGVGLAAISISFTREFAQLLPILIILGLIAGAYHPSAISQLPQFFPVEKRGRALGYHMIGGSFGFMLGPFLCGIIAGVTGWRTVYLLLSLPAVCTALLLLKTMRREWKVSTEVEAAEADTGFWTAVRSIAVILGISIMAQFIVGSAINYVPIYFVDMHSVNPAHAAMLLALVRFGSVIAAPLGGAMTDRFGIKKTVMVSVVGVGPALFLVAVLPFHFVTMVVTLFLLGVFLLIRQPAMQALIVQVTSQKHRSTLLGLYFFLAMEGMSLMIPLAGYLMDSLGLFPTFIGISISALALSVLTLLIRAKLLPGVSNSMFKED